MLICRSPAKINLCLDVLSRRDDGYHELQSVAHTVGLWDTLAFEFGGAGFSLRCNDAALETQDNLCWHAARAWQSATQIEIGGLKIALQKIIPSGAGLGGGSGNAAATLLALNRKFDEPLNANDLSEVAATLGADVPLFLRGGCVLMEGVGEKLTPLPPLSGWLLLAQPTRGLSTPAVYRRFDELEKTSMRATSALLAAMKTGELKQIADALGNDLTAAAQSLGEDVNGLIAKLRECGALSAEMTGSGSCVFGIFVDEATARAALRQCEGNPLFHRVFVAPLVGAGVEMVDGEVA